MKHSELFVGVGIFVFWALVILGAEIYGTTWSEITYNNTIYVAKAYDGCLFLRKKYSLQSAVLILIDRENPDYCNPSNTYDAVTCLGSTSDNCHNARKIYQLTIDTQEKNKDTAIANEIERKQKKARSLFE